MENEKGFEFIQNDDIKKENFGTVAKVTSQKLKTHNQITHKRGTFLETLASKKAATRRFKKS